MKKILLFLSLSFSGINLYAQQEHTLHFMQDIGQFNYTNPAFISNYKVTVGLPGLSSNFIGLGNTGFSYNDLVFKKPGGELYMDLNNMVGNLEAENHFNTDIQADLLFVNFKAGPRLNFSLNLSAKSFNSLMYPGDLFDFVVNGNAHRIGESMEFSPQVTSTSYLELGVGAAFKVNRKLNIGARVKLLDGIGNAITDYSNLQLSTHADSYDLSALAAVSIRTSNFNRLEQDEEDTDFQDYLGNRGVAFDLGASYQVNDRFSLAVSVLDIGSINWSQDTREYYLDPETANYTFSGAAINELLEDGSAPFDEIGDEIEANFEFQDRSIESYSSQLPLKSYISGRYELSPTLTTGALVFFENYEDNWKEGISLNLAKEFGKILSASVSYSAMNDTYNNIGGGLALNLAPFQLYLVSDNLINMAYSGVANGELNDYINNTQSVNFRFGLNFVFGREKSGASQLPR